MWYHLTIVILLFANFCCEAKEYHWEVYNGTLPIDALEAEPDSNENTIYIGQATINGRTVIIPINPEKQEFTAADGETTVTVSLPFKILCGSEIAIYWKRAKGETLHVDLIHDTPIVAGENEEGLSYIGRVSYQDGIKIGSVSAYELNHASIHFVYKNKILSSENYEILMYEDPRPRRRRPNRPPRRRF